MKIPDFPIKELPKSLSFKNLLGPSFIILGLGLGSGEIILWPFLASNWGLGIIWGAIIGITFQFFMNMEIERYALARGESVFVGYARKIKGLTYWFILSTFIPWVWPGLSSTSAKIFGRFFGWENTNYLAIVFLIIIGLILSLGPVLYKTVESLQKTLIIIGVPVIFIFAIVLAGPADWIELAEGAVGIGNGYFFLPAGIVIADFLAAFAFAGAGGNLNLAQSSYIREKGYGMGKYTGRITSLLTGQKEDISITGSRFEITEQSVKDFKQWWKNINLEHFVIFWLTGAITISLLGLLAYSTTHGLEGVSKGINFLFLESEQIGLRLAPWAGVFFLITTGVMLFATQLTVLDATSRILSENVILASSGKFLENKIPHIYYIVLWIQILAGIFILLVGKTEPRELLITNALLNAFAMFIHVALTLWLNFTSLEKPLRPSLIRTIVLLTAFSFYGFLGFYTIYDSIIK